MVADSLTREDAADDEALSRLNVNATETKQQDNNRRAELRCTLEHNKKRCGDPKLQAEEEIDDP